MNNPLLRSYQLPPFDQISVEHLEPAIEALEKRVREQLAMISSLKTVSWDLLMKPIEELSAQIERVVGPITHLNGVKNTPLFREKWNELEPRVVALHLEVMQNPSLFTKMKSLRENDKSLDPVQIRILDQLLLDAKLAGIELEGEEKVEFNQIKAKLSQLSSQFQNNALDSTKEFSLILSSRSDIDGLPPSLLALTSQSYNEQKGTMDEESTPETGPWRISLSPPVFVPFMQHSKSRLLREKVYKAYITRASFGSHDNTPLIAEILKLRKKEASLLGFPSYADLSLTKKMAQKVSKVETMFEELREVSWKATNEEIAELRAFALSKGEKEPLLHWDTAYWSERYREHTLSFTQEEVRPYFSLPKAIEGLCLLCNKLFGITIREEKERPPVWHPDVRYYTIRDENDKQIASFYLDPYSRPENKRGGAWMDSCLTRRNVNGSLQLPVAHIVCNFTPPVGSKPSLLTFDELTTLFHEFGHATQHMLTKVDHFLASGISMVEWDAVEIASQFMENWCFHKPTLIALSSHVDTGKPLPDELFDKIYGTRTFMAGSHMLRQLQLGTLDMTLHHSFVPKNEEYPTELVKSIVEKTSILPYLPEERFLCSFSHIFSGGYAAGYYSYKWAEVMSSDAFGAFEEGNLSDSKELAKIGKRYKETFLALGGGTAPLKVFQLFRGRDPSIEALLRHHGLLNEKSK